MKPTKQLLATLLTLIMLLGLIPGAGAAELNAEYSETRYSDIASTTYSRMLMLRNNAFVASNNAGKYGLVSLTGEVKLPYEYDSLYLTRDGVYLAEKNGQKLLIDAEGNVKITSAQQIKLLEKSGLYYADSKLYNAQGDVQLENVQTDNWNWFPGIDAQNGILDVGGGKYYTEDGLQESNNYLWQGATLEGAEKLKAYDTATRMYHNWYYDTNVDYFLVEKNNQRGVTDLEGNVVIALGDYTSIDPIEDGNDVSFVVSAVAGKALYNAQGQKVVDFGIYSNIWSDGYWDRTYPYVIWEDLFSVENASGQKGKIDASGKVILPMGDYGWRLPGLNQKGFIAGKDGDVYKLYNRNGELVKTFNHYVATEVYYRDLVFATTTEPGSGIKYGVMNENGTTLVAAELDGLSLDSECWSPDNMLRATKKDSKVVLYDENYSPVYTDYKGIEYISEGRYLLYDGNYYGIGKNDGTFTVPVEYADIRIHNPEIIELYNGETYSLTNVDGDALVLPSTEESKLYGINPWDGIDPWMWTFSTNLNDTDYLKSAYDGDDVSVMPFISKTAQGTTTTYMDYHTGEIIGTLPVEASNILPSGEFVFKDAAGKFGIGKLIQDLLPVKVTVTPPAGVAYGTTLGDPVAQQEAISDGVDASATWSYLYEGTTRAGVAYSSATKPTQAGTYTVTATLVSQTHTGSKKSAAFTIAPKALTADMLTVSGTYTYTGSEITPTYAVADGNLLKTSDYTAAVSDNVNAGNGKVTVTATQTGNYTGNAEKNFTIAKAPIGALKPLVIGDAVVGKALGVNLNEVNLSGINWKWLREGQTIDNATGRSYLLTPADSNKSISVRAEATPDGNYTGTTLDGDALKVAKQAASGTVAVTLSGSDDGTAKTGSTLTAAVSFQPSEAESGAAYQWYRGETVIDGAVNAAYIVTETDAGAVLKVVATAGADFTGTAQNTVAVGKKLLDGTLSLALTTDNDDNSVANIGDVLTATLTGDAAPEDYTLVWLANKAVVEGATGSTHTVTAADQGKEISVSAQAKGETYTGELLSNGIAVPAGVPAAPQVTARAGDGTIYFAWTVPTDNGAPVLGYDITFTGAEETTQLPATARDVIMEGLANGTAYTLTLIAKNSVGSSAPGSATATPATPYNPGSGGSSSNTTTETKKNEDGSITKTVTDKKTGSTTSTTSYPDGTKIVATTPKDGKTAIEVTVPKGKETVTVTIPTDKKPAPGEVLAIVKEDGTKEIIKTSVATEDGMRVILGESAKLEIVDNSKSFGDIPTNQWFTDAVQFVSSRELFSGTSKDSFSPESDMTRGMLVTVLARFDGKDTAKGERWDSVGIAWAKESGISDGAGMNDSITREQLAVMLYRYAKAEKAEVDLKDFTDASDVSAWAQEAVQWAVKSGIINGAGGKLNPADTASRAEVAAMFQRFISAPIK